MECKGFSLIELLIVTIILAILAGVAIPGLGKQLNAAQIDSTTDSLVETLNLARHTAVSKNQLVVIRPLTDWSSGWQLFIDNNSDGQLSPNETLLQQISNPPRITIKSAMTVNNYIAFTGSGAAQTITGAFFAGTLRICPATGGSGGMAVKIRLGGRIRTEKLSAAQCAILVAG